MGALDYLSNFCTVTSTRSKRKALQVPIFITSNYLTFTYINIFEVYSALLTYIFCNMYLMLSLLLFYAMVYVFFLRRSISKWKWTAMDVKEELKMLLPTWKVILLS